jgi:hypothetical protein
VEKIIIEAKQPKAIKTAAGGFILLLLSISLCVIGMRDKRTVYWLIGFISSVFFLISFIILCGKTRIKKPLITITFDGIIDSSTNSVGYIPFKDIKQFTIVNVMGVEVLGIKPRDDEGFIKKLPPTMQNIARIRQEENHPPFTIDVSNAKDMTLKDIYTLLRKRLMDYSSLYD